MVSGLPTPFPQMPEQVSGRMLSHPQQMQDCFTDSDQMRPVRIGCIEPFTDACIAVCGFHPALPLYFQTFPAFIAYPKDKEYFYGSSIDGLYVANTLSISSILSYSPSSIFRSP